LLKLIVIQRIDIEYTPDELKYTEYLEKCQLKNERYEQNIP